VGGGGRSEQAQESIRRSGTGGLKQEVSQVAAAHKHACGRDRQHLHGVEGGGGGGGEEGRASEA
jgi:hypothetical protein